MALTAEEMKKAELEKMRQQFAGSDARSEFIKDREQERTNAWHEANRQARIDRLEGMIGAGAGRYSPIQIKQTQDQLDYLRGGGVAGLREHEKRMADTTGEWAVKKEAEHAKGLRGQGAEAATINAEANRDIAKINSDAQTISEATKGRYALDIAKENNQSLLERSKLEQASHEKIAGIQADSAKYGADASVDVQTEKNKGEAARAVIDQAKLDQTHQNRMAEIVQRESMRQANSAELKMIRDLQSKPEYKNVPPQQLLALIRIGTITQD